MGIIQSSLILEKGLRAEFLKAFGQSEDPSDVKPFIMETTSSARSEKYGWLGAVPQMSTWTDKRNLRGLTGRSYE